MGSIINLSSNFLQSILSNGLQGVSSSSKSPNQINFGAQNSVTQPSDSQQISPFAQLLSTLQQLQQSNPTQYAQVTKQIATNLTTAAQSAQSSGDTAAATQLNQLATDFTAASTSGQLPNIQDLAQAVGGGGGHHGHHHHSEAASSTADATSTSTAATSSSSAGSTLAQSLSQLVALLQNSTSGAAGGAQNSLNPLAIIDSTLSNAGITSATGSN
jgi:hypothetical protein